MKYAIILLVLISCSQKQSVIRKPSSEGTEDNVYSCGERGSLFERIQECNKRKLRFKSQRFSVIIMGEDSNIVIKDNVTHFFWAKIKSKKNDVFSAREECKRAGSQVGEILIDWKLPGLKHYNSLRDSEFKKFFDDSETWYWTKDSSSINGQHKTYHAFSLINAASMDFHPLQKMNYLCVAKE